MGLTWKHPSFLSVVRLTLNSGQGEPGEARPDSCPLKLKYAVSAVRTGKRLSQYSAVNSCSALALLLELSGALCDQTGPCHGIKGRERGGRRKENCSRHPTLKEFEDYSHCCSDPHNLPDNFLSELTLCVELSLMFSDRM